MPNATNAKCLMPRMPDTQCQTTTQQLEQQLLQQLEEQHTINCKEWRTTKLRVYKRDHSQCIECNTKKHLSLHFKDFTIKNYRDENLELLCRKCHWKKHLEAYNEVPLSKESKELVDKGLEEAKEGKIEECPIKKIFREESDKDRV